MQEIDEVIDQHGGWPGAFQVEAPTGENENGEIQTATEPVQDYGN